MKPRKLVIPVVDLFAGPGGLAEGFACFRDEEIRFEVSLSVEKDEAAHKTLTLRHFFRQFRHDATPSDYYDYLRTGHDETRRDLFDRYPRERDAALASSLRKELGTADDEDVHRAIASRVKSKELWVLVGGPPCQAYSIVGRSRMSDRSRQRFEADRRHYLYREYLNIIARFRPPIFVMENVKGLLSSKIQGNLIFERILSDLRSPREALAQASRVECHSKSALGYKVVPVDVLGEPAQQFRSSDFLICAERFGVPQRRHRVILLGVRSDVRLDSLSFLERQHQAPAVFDVLSDLPPLRSQLSREPDSAEAWSSALHEAWRNYFSGYPDREVRRFAKYAVGASRDCQNIGGRFVAGLTRSTMSTDLKCWYRDPALRGAVNHESRPHRRDDLARYLFVSCFGFAHGRSPKLSDFPEDLLPNHRNALRARETSELFDDRFRVQVAHEPAMTVTAHIAKDGHYYIHYDPSQCRSWTVREAARVQTFPDNLLF